MHLNFKISLHEIVNHILLHYLMFIGSVVMSFFSFLIKTISAFSIYFFFFLISFVVARESICKAGDSGSIPELEGLPGEGNGDPLQYSCLENSMDIGAWQASPWGCKESDTTERLTHTINFIHLLKDPILVLLIFCITFYLFFKLFNWRLITLQSCGFCYILT